MRVQKRLIDLLSLRVSSFAHRSQPLSSLRKLRVNRKRSPARTSVCALTKCQMRLEMCRQTPDSHACLAKSLENGSIVNTGR